MAFTKRTVSREIHPRVFYNESVVASYEHFVGNPNVEWICKAAVANADNMAERVFYFWNYIATKDESAPDDLKGQARDAIHGFKRVLEYRNHLAKIVCSEFQLIWDIHDAHKHYELKRPGRLVTHADQTGKVPMVFQCADRIRIYPPVSEASLSQIFVVNDNDESIPVLNALTIVLSMWEDELSRMSL